MTLKKAIMVGLVCAILATLGATAYAGWGGCCGFFFFGSIGTGLTVRGGGPDDAFVTWTVTPEEYEFLCVNPAGNEASLTVMLRQVSLSTLVGVDPKNGTGRNGKIELTGAIDIGLLAKAEDCINPNWHPDPDSVFIRHFDATAEVFTLDDDGKSTREFLAIYKCWFNEAGFGAGNLPDPGTPYECDETIEQK